MNKETILARIKTLETERDQLKNSLVLYEGALQDAQYWLDQLDTPEDKKED